MRKNIVAGNWKMNKTLQEGVALLYQIIVNILIVHYFYLFVVEVMPVTP